MILKMILKSFDCQCDFDFQITTSKMILILNHLYLGDLILILKSSTFRDGQNHHMLMILKSKSNHLNKGDLKSNSKSFWKW